MFYVSLQRYIKWEIVLYLKLLHNNTKKRPGSKLWGCAYLLMMLCLCCKCFPLLFLFCSNALTFSICNCSFILLHTGETNHIKNIKCAWFEELHVWALQTWALFYHSQHCEVQTILNNHHNQCNLLNQAPVSIWSGIALELEIRGGREGKGGGTTHTPCSNQSPLVTLPPHLQAHNVVVQLPAPSYAKSRQNMHDWGNTWGG